MALTPMRRERAGIALGCSETSFAAQQIDIGEGAIAEKLVLIGHIGGPVIQRPVSPGPVEFFSDDFQKQLNSFRFQDATTRRNEGLAAPALQVYLC